MYSQRVRAHLIFTSISLVYANYLEFLFNFLEMFILENHTHRDGHIGWVIDLMRSVGVSYSDMFYTFNEILEQRVFCFVSA
jgi:hypothetical protein